MGRATARPRVIRGTRTAPLPLLPSGPGGVCGRPLHGARDLTRNHRITALPGATPEAASASIAGFSRSPGTAARRGAEAPRHGKERGAVDGPAGRAGVRPV